jgi:hypothetical protein
MLRRLRPSRHASESGDVPPTLQAGFYVGRCESLSRSDSQGFSLGLVPAAFQAARCHASRTSADRALRGKRVATMLIGLKGRWCPTQGKSLGLPAKNVIVAGLKGRRCPRRLRMSPEGAAMGNHGVGPLRPNIARRQKSELGPTRRSGRARETAVYAKKPETKLTTPAAPTTRLR